MNQLNLKKEALNVANKINNAELHTKPFKHIQIDNIFSNELIENCLKNFPKNTSSKWEESNSKDIEIKKRTAWESEFDIPEGIVDAVRIMNSSIFLKAMSDKMWIKKIIPDPYFTWWWLNLTLKDWLLDIHVDWNYHDASWLNRRLNAIVYLNKDWLEEWWGDFEIWENDLSKCTKKISPIFNRLVIFDSHDKSFHGSPHPLNCPKENGRKSIILYYYTKEERPNDQISVKDPHSALWMKKGLTDKKWNKTRDYE